MARSKKDEPGDFRPIVVDVPVNKNFRPISVGVVAPAADAKKTPKPAAGTKED